MVLSLSQSSVGTKSTGSASTATTTQQQHSGQIAAHKGMAVHVRCEEKPLGFKLERKLLQKLMEVRLPP